MKRVKLQERQHTILLNDAEIGEIAFALRHYLSQYDNGAMLAHNFQALSADFQDLDTSFYKIPKDSA